MPSPVYALNLFNVSDRDEYLAYSRRSASEVRAHGGRVVALGEFREAVAGEIAPHEGHFQYQKRTVVLGTCNCW